MGVIPNRIRYINKRFLNGIIRKFAGKPLVPLAVIRHVGRRSGKPYETPVIVVPFEDGFAVALTYGQDVDWYRNVQAAGRCTVLWHGKEYPINRLEPLDAQIAIPAFPLPLRLLMRTLGTRHFVKMNDQPVAPGSP